MAAAQDPIVVDKFGGSVLRRPADIAAAVEAVADQRRSDLRPVVVVSAFEGVTDTILASAAVLLPDGGAALREPGHEASSAFARETDRARVRVVGRREQLLRRGLGFGRLLGRSGRGRSGCDRVGCCTFTAACRGDDPDGRHDRSDQNDGRDERHLAASAANSRGRSMRARPVACGIGHSALPLKTAGAPPVGHAPQRTSYGVLPGNPGSTDRARSSSLRCGS